MAPRLAVVVSQSPTRDARTADIEESIVAELIMVGGLDATLVGPLERIEADSTDQLCLSGFTQDLRFSPGCRRTKRPKHWQTLQLGGIVVPMSLDGSAELASGERGVRRVFYIQLKSDSQAKLVCQQLKARLDLMRVKPVSLQLNLKLPTKAPTVNSTVSGATVAGRTASPAIAQGSQGSDDHPPTMNKTSATDSNALESKATESTTSNSRLSPNNASREDESDEEWMELDRLVDDLDAPSICDLPVNVIGKRPKISAQQQSQVVR